MKKAVIAISLLMIVVMAGGAFAYMGEGMGMGRGMGHGPMKGDIPPGQHMRWWDNPDLNLSAEQKAQLKARFLAHRQEVAPIRNSLTQKRLELEVLLAAPEVNKDKVLAKQKELFALQSAMQEKHLSFQLEQRQVLTPEQRVLAGPIRLHGRGFRGPR